MTTTFQVADGHDNEMDLEDLVVQPTSKGIAYAKYVSSPGGKKVPKGDPYTAWGFSSVITETQGESILTQLGLDETTCSAQVTVNTRVFGSTFDAFNATISWEPGKTRREAGLWYDFELLVSQLREPA
jgi:hypothetical protein